MTGLLSELSVDSMRLVLDSAPVPIALVLGLLVGSFLNVVIYRLPIIMKNQWEADIEQYRLEQAGDDQATAINTGNTTVSPRFNLWIPRSHCPACKGKIAAWHNIPVLGFLMLRGRCPHCNARISLRYPMVELLTGLLFAALAIQTQSVSAALPWMGLVAALIALAGIDWDTYLLPDDITLPLMWAGLVVNLWTHTIPLQDALIGAMAGYLSLWSVYHVFKWATGKEGMGFGDFKLLAALGAWFGWVSLPSIILMSSLVGAVAGVLVLKLKGKDRHHPIPFGPALVVGGLSWLYEVPARDWLIRLTG